MKALAVSEEAKKILTKLASSAMEAGKIGRQKLTEDECQLKENFYRQIEKDHGFRTMIQVADSRFVEDLLHASYAAGELLAGVKNEDASEAERSESFRKLTELLN